MNARTLVEKMKQEGSLRSRAMEKAFLAVPREEFVPEEYRGMAYFDQPLPIGFGQTISQPSMIAIMLESLGISPGMKVLEVGSGSGYVLALLEEITGREAYGIERIPELCERAEKTLKRLGYRSRVFCGDGKKGLPELSPFDRIVVSASSDEVPPSLLEQLAENGILGIPLRRGDEVFCLVRKDGRIEEVVPCRFVPLV